LYGWKWNFRYIEIASQIKDGENVLELCAGDGALSEYLPGNKYIGVDANNAFVNYGKKKGRNLISADIISYSFPVCDVLVMISSFYHFLTSPLEMLEKMKRCSLKKVIICENYKCFSTSSNRTIAKLGRALSTTSFETGNQRWTKEALEHLFITNGFQEVYCKNNFLFAIWKKPGLI
jgi:ubiquinone/menaquinone biosynthesis C-methylase UbiE